MHNTQMYTFTTCTFCCKELTQPISRTHTHTQGAGNDDLNDCDDYDDDDNDRVRVRSLIAFEPQAYRVYGVVDVVML